MRRTAQSFPRSQCSDRLMPLTCLGMHARHPATGLQSCTASGEFPRPSAPPALRRGPTKRSWPHPPTVRLQQIVWNEYPCFLRVAATWFILPGMAGMHAALRMGVWRRQLSGHLLLVAGGDAHLHAGQPAQRSCRALSMPRSASRFTCSRLCRHHLQLHHRRGRELPYLHQQWGAWRAPAPRGTAAGWDAVHTRARLCMPAS